LFENPTIAELSSLLQGPTEKSLLPAIEVQQRPALIPLSFSQERLWFIDQLEGSVQYHIPAVLLLKGKLQVEALTYALQTIVQRHEVLRTVILEVNGAGYQHVLDNNNCNLVAIDGRTLKNDSEALQDTIQNFIRKPFDLSKDQPLRVGLVDLDGDENILVVAMHHIASDGWSLSIIVKELVELYGANIEGREHKLSPLKIQYADYAIWQRNYLQGKVLDNKIAYWKEKLDGVAPLQLPLDFERPVVQTMNGATANFKIDTELTTSLQQLSQQQGTTMFMTLLAAFNVLFHRHSGQQDICIGTPIANRTQQEVEELIGFFVNTLALRNNVDGSASFTELLQQVKETTMEAYEHQDVPFEKVVDMVIKERDLSRTPLFQVMFVLHNTPEIPQLRLGEVELSSGSFKHNTAKI
jgi:NRPS condensation-like uncharacterized protein